jgi:predicted Zn finger-like uncharacterized protein
MDIICDSCKAKLNIPDEKLPPGKKLAVTCPKCQEKLLVSRPSEEKKEKKAEKPVKDVSDTIEKTEVQDQDDKDEFLEFYGEDRNLALVIENNDDVAEKIKASVVEMGYKYVRANNTREAIARLREYNFGFVALSDRFDGIELEFSPILEYLNHLSMSLRRRLFLVLIGENFKTMDLLTAFAMSANLVVGSNDLDNLKRALKQSIAEYKKFYSIFMETLEEVGKE